MGHFGLDKHLKEDVLFQKLPKLNVQQPTRVELKVEENVKVKHVQDAVDDKHVVDVDV